MPDYTKLSGAEFQRAVGADPEKWAEAFIQNALWLRSFEGVVKAAGGPEGNQQGVVAGWFRDAMAAAVKAARREDDDLVKVGIWKPGDSLTMDDDGPTEYPKGRPR